MMGEHKKSLIVAVHGLSAPSLSLSLSLSLFPLSIPLQTRILNFLLYVYNQGPLAGEEYAVEMGTE